MTIPDPPPNSLGLDLVHPEPEHVLDPQPTSTSLLSSSPQPETQLTTAITDTESTVPTTGTTKVHDVTKSNVSKKSPYINPERVKTGGLPRDKLTEEELAERMARMREQNEKIKQRRLDVVADEDAFKQTQAAERHRQAQMRKVQETVNRTREQNARRKMDKIQSREWDSDKKAEGWLASAESEQPGATSSPSTTRTNSGADRSAEASASLSPKQREDANRGHGIGRRGRGRGRVKGESRNKVTDRSPLDDGDGGEKVEAAGAEE
ncbi:hypothetical protein B0F90DRAFT_1665919 [Multifurca ochricompacta]|uniref:Uncharacterized protein n=1 Tax=Multifurca ochricompacta TaxID=376703 RepID=A0AAD4MBT0_9AGAM|nr:hypothetical protein B0F90DRAFT_1665919 [Multifurca ochricompacta]